MGTLSGGVWTWTAETSVVSDSSGYGDLQSITCSDSTTCIAVGQDNGTYGPYQQGNGITTIGTYSGGAWSWAPEVLESSALVGYGPLAGVSCATSTSCIAVGSFNNSLSINSIGTLSGGNWSWSDEAQINSPALPGYLTSESCPSSTMCLAVGTDANFNSITSVGTLSGGSWSWSAETSITADSTGYGVLNSISCPDSTTCIAVGQDSRPSSVSDTGDKGITTVGTFSGGVWAWTTETDVTPDSYPDSGALTTVTCSSSSSCTAFGYNLSGQYIYTTGTLSGGSWSWTRESLVSTSSPLYGLLNSSACPNSTTCIDTGAGSNSLDVTTLGSPTFQSVPNGVEFVSDGSDQVFDITPDAGYQISNVLVDGVSVGTPSSYTFTNVTVGHTLEADFTPSSPVITATTVGPGSISVNDLSASPSGTISGSSSMRDVTCVSTVNCVAVGSDYTTAGSFGRQGITSSGSFSGGSWTWTTAAPVGSDPSGGADLYSVSCPTLTMCIAVGGDGNGRSVYSVGTYSGSSWTWATEASITPDSTDQGILYSVSCPTSTSCIAVGEDYGTGGLQGIYTSGTYSGGNWTWTTEAEITPDPNGFGYLDNVSCPTSSMCIAVGNDDDNLGVTSVGTYSGGSWTWTRETIIPIGSTGGADVYGISCPNSTTCVVVGSDDSGSEQGVVSSGTYSGGNWTWSPEVNLTSDSSGVGYLTAVNCPISTLCVAVGYDSDNDNISTIGTYSGGSWTWTTEATSGLTNFNANDLELGVFCYDFSDCVMVGGVTPSQGEASQGTISGGNITWNNQNIPLDSTGNGSVSAVGCPSSTTCIAIQSESTDGYNSPVPVYSIGTLTGNSWTWTPDTAILGDTSGGSTLNSMSCPTSIMCVATGINNNNQSIYSVGTLSGGNWTWMPEASIASDSHGVGWLYALSCPTSTMCIAVGTDNYRGIDTVGTLSGGNWTWTTEADMTANTFASESFTGIDCVSSTSCIAIGEDGFQDSYTVGSYSGGNWTWSTEVDIASDPSGYGASGYGAITGISCTSTIMCIAVGSDGNQQGISAVGTYSGGNWTWSTEAPILSDSSGTGILNSINCLSSGLCVAVGTDANSQSVITLGTTSGSTITWTPESVVTPDSTGFGNFTGVVCNTSNSCLSVGTDNQSIGNYSADSLFGSVPVNGFLADTGSNQLFDISPNAGYVITNVLVDGISVGTPSSYTFTNVTVGHTIEAIFGLLTHILTVAAGAGGNVSPSGAIAVDDGSSQVVDVTPNSGYSISGYFSNGSYSCTPSGSNAVCTVSNITSNEYITANFAVNTNTLTVSAEPGGSVSPAGAISVDYGSNKEISVKPDSGYHITGYSSNGSVSCTPSGSDSVCTISNITSNKYFTADFAATPITPSSTFIITSSANGPGTITPNGDNTVTDGGSQVFTIAANTGSKISSVLVDGVDEGAISSYTFSNVTSAHTIEAIFTTPATLAPTGHSSSGHTTQLAVVPPKPATNPITAITRFVNIQFNRVPTPVAIGFPWLLLILLLLMVIWATRLAYKEAKTVQEQTELLHESKALAEAKNTFLQLATHYLATPLAKLTGGVSLLASTNSDPSVLPKLQSQTADIQLAAQNILTSINADAGVAEAKPVLRSEQLIGQAWRRIWIYVVVIGILGFLIDNLAHSARDIRTSSIAEATHAAIYVLLCFVLYGALRYYRIQLEKHMTTEDLITEQDSLNASRTKVIKTAYQNLSVPVAALGVTARQLTPGSTGSKSIDAALKEYHSVLDKMKTVVELQTTPLATTQSVNLLSVLQPATTALRANIETKKLSLNYAPGIAEQNVLADPTELNKIVTAILDNAIKFSPNNSSIAIGYEATHSSLSLTIADNGRGIDPEYAERLFQPFSRAQADALTSNHEGIGLSLYSSKLLAQSLHGDIGFSSTPGQGTIVAITLPKPTKAALARLARQQASVHEASSAEQQIVYSH